MKKYNCNSLYKMDKVKTSCRQKMFWNLKKILRFHTKNPHEEFFNLKIQQIFQNNSLATNLLETKRNELSENKNRNCDKFQRYGDRWRISKGVFGISGFIVFISYVNDTRHDKLPVIEATVIVSATTIFVL